MYLDALFSISVNGISVMKEIDKSRRLNYILGLDSNQSFTDHMINIADFGDSISLFYKILMLPELHLSELIEENVQELYRDRNFFVFYLDNKKVKNFSKKLNEIDIKYYKTALLISEGICSMSPYTEEEKFHEFKNIVMEASIKKANLLFIMRYY